MKKILTIAFLAATLLTLTTGTVFAQEATPITGTVDSVTVNTDPITGETTSVTVMLTDDGGVQHTVDISQATAEALGLVTVDPVTGEVTPNEVVDPITIDPLDILPTDGGTTGEGEEEAQHPVGSKLGEFFGELVGVDYDAIMEQHEKGFGFGVIAQALWLTNEIEGGTETFTALLKAKKSGDYSDIVLADGSTPDNWGDVVKSLKKGDNLGSVMSGKADNGSEDTLTTTTTTTTTETEESTGGQGKGNSKGNGGNNGHGNGGGQGKGNGGGKVHGGGKP